MSKVSIVGLLASAVVGFLGYLVGAPVEAVVILLLLGTIAQLLFFGDR